MRLSSTASRRADGSVLTRTRSGSNDSQVEKVLYRSPLSRLSGGPSLGRLARKNAHQPASSTRQQHARHAAAT